jgi:hypothetical protein
MKVVFTIAKRQLEDGTCMAAGVEEILAENVKSFCFDEAIQRVRIFYNDGKDETLALYKGDDKQAEQWFLLDIKCIQVPLKVEL